MQKALKVIFLGQTATGKSSILYRYLMSEQRILKGTKSNQNFPTVGVEVGSRSFFIQNTNIHIQFWDTAGQERFRSVCRQHYNGAQAVILVYDISNRRTFQNLMGFITDVREYVKKEDIPICLLGNKVDKGQREVAKAQALNFIAENKITMYEEVSAETGQNLEQAVAKFLKIFAKPLQTASRVQLSSQPARSDSKCC